MKLNNKTAKILKKDFPIFKNNLGLIYLDSAATSQKPKKVINAIADFYEKENANISRGLYTLAEKATMRYEASRSVVADFIGAEKNEVVFTRNSTESLNLLSYTILPLIRKGKDEILLTEMEHHSNIVPWQELAKRLGFKLKFVKIKSDFTLDMNDLKNKLSDKTAIVAFTYISNVLGTINSVKEIVKIAKQKGAITIIDAAQAIQHLSINVKNIGCDFLVFSSHKMLGPMGVGVLYGRSELLEKMKPFNFGGGMIKKVSLESVEFANVPQRFEAGTQNVPGVIGLAEAIRYIKKIGIKDIVEWDKQLLQYTLNKLKDVKGIEVYNPGINNGVGIISFNLKGIHPHDVSELLNKEGVAIRAGHHCAMPLMKALNVSGTCRVSFYIYNTFEDVDKLVKSLKKIRGRFMR